jgi:hypothetical protein
MNERTKTVRRKIERAGQHIREYESMEQLFLQRNPYLTVKEMDSDTGEMLWRVSIREEIPADFPTIVGDALQNLRSALDHLVWQLVLANGSTPKIGVTGFPICESVQKYTTESLARVKGAAQGAVNMINNLRPYYGGHQHLWGLHALNNADKHRLLLFAAAWHTGTSFSVPLSLEPQKIIVPCPNPGNFKFPLEDGTELFRVSVQALKSGFNQDPKFTFRIVFGDAGGLNAQPLLPPLRQLADLVNAIVVSFDEFLV